MTVSSDSKGQLTTKTWGIHLSDPWFDLVRTGQKVYEGRRYAFDVPKYKVGDNLHITRCGPKGECLANAPSYTMKITSLHQFPTFEAALKVLPLTMVLPGISSLEEGVLLYQKYVSLPTQHKDTVCLIGVKIL